MSIDLTHGVNPYQSVEGMVKEYEKLEAKRDAELHDPDESTTPREHMEPSTEGITMVRKGRLNPATGAEIPPTAKTRTAQTKQFGTPSQAYLSRYDLIRWDR